ncbi:MAG: nitrite reductase large subunit NirB [Acidimicrobiales bacterium]
MATLVLAGHGMVGHRFLEAAVERGMTETWELVTFAEEPRPAYDRVNLSSFFEGATAEDLSLVGPGFLDTPGLTVHLGDRVEAIDPATSTVRSAAGQAIAYDALVVATGSCPFVPPIPGTDGRGSFVYRTIEDLEAIRAWASRPGVSRGAVVGGGLLGLEAANALRLLGLETYVVEFAPRLLAVQLDDGGGRALRGRVEELGLEVLTAKAATAVTLDADGVVAGLTFDDGTDLRADLVVFAAGIRPRDDLARACGLVVGERGGVAVDDTLQASAPNVFAIGECASHRGRVYGLVAPGYAMADVVADRLSGRRPDAVFTGADLSTKLKLLGVEVASIGDAQGTTAGAHEIVYDDAVGRIYKKVVVSPAKDRVLGAVLVGDSSRFTVLRQLAAGGDPLPGDPMALLFSHGPSALELGDEATVCSCHNVSATRIRAAIGEQELDDVAAIKACTKAGTGCGSCVPVLQELLADQLRRSGRQVLNHLCEHFPYTRAELFDIVRVKDVRSFGRLVREHGSGRGCEICKPAVASMLASLSTGYILDGEQASLQDTNDHFLANLQRDGSYSVVPRVPGGEITPEKLIVLGEVARDFDLYSKITGAQRIDLFGARVDQLPAIWRRLVDAGFESGHAYGKALRTVKSCVGTSWCRYGVQDAVSLAIDLELRYRGLRSPHKIKCAVSGCARECAEAQGKDVGVIATEKGWNLHVCGNGGMRPQHAVLLTEDLDTDSLVRLIDRFLMFYIRTADRLERTATWFNKLDGGVDYLREVLIEDSLGVCADLEADMAHHVATYECEWKATLEDPARLARFTHFVNSEEPDPTPAYVRVRGQKQPV